MTGSRSLQDDVARLHLTMTAHRTWQRLRVGRVALAEEHCPAWGGRARRQKRKSDGDGDGFVAWEPREVPKKELAIKRGFTVGRFAVDSASAA
jgi:hypothetical protein